MPPARGGNVKKSLHFFEVWKRVSEIMPECVFGLHRRNRIACAPFPARAQKRDSAEWFLLNLLGTCSQDGRSGVRGLSQGCQRRAPEITNVAPALPSRPPGAQSHGKLVPGCPKRAQGVAKGTQVVPKRAPEGAQGCPEPPHVLTSNDFRSIGDGF